MRNIGHAGGAYEPYGHGGPPCFTTRFVFTLSGWAENRQSPGNESDRQMQGGELLRLALVLPVGAPRASALCVDIGEFGTQENDLRRIVDPDKHDYYRGCRSIG